MNLSVPLTDITKYWRNKSRIDAFLDKIRIVTKIDCICSHQMKFNKLKDIKYVFNMKVNDKPLIQHSLENLQILANYFR